MLPNNISNYEYKKEEPVLQTGYQRIALILAIILFLAVGIFVVYFWGGSL